ncbi:MAG: biopolymer transporter ExbD [Pseudobdellovibrio sp.]
MSNDKVKGSAARIVQVPGYHLHPQYDMVHTRHILEERKNKKKSFHLNMAPMVDMFSVLVIYLIMNFSSSGEIYFVSKSVTIPKATKGIAMESFPIISVVKDKISFDAESVGGEQSVFVEELNDEKAPKLRAMLQKVASIEKQISGTNKFRGQVNLQADVNASVEDVKKVMRVLIDEGWTGINFIVDPSSKK